MCPPTPSSPRPYTGREGENFQSTQFVMVLKPILLTMIIISIRIIVFTIIFDDFSGTCVVIMICLHHSDNLHHDDCLYNLHHHDRLHNLHHHHLYQVWLVPYQRQWEQLRSSARCIVITIIIIMTVVIIITITIIIVTIIPSPSSSSSSSEQAELFNPHWGDGFRSEHLWPVSRGSQVCWGAHA